MPAPINHATDTAVLLCNLGTPDAPTPKALRTYLAQFLSDRRVVELPRPLWMAILHGVILRVRPSKSAEKYRLVWDQGGAKGSPLLHWSQEQARELENLLQIPVACAMRYGNPSIASQLDALTAKGVQRILIVPLYPQYSATTTASVYDAVCAWMERQRLVPELRFIQHYSEHRGYIKALAQSVRQHWAQKQEQGKSRAQKLIMSFHGIPQRNCELGDPYDHQCRRTGQLLAQELGLREDEYLVTFQSRFGRARWLQPYTQPTLEELGRSGLSSAEVICPGFVSDCIETLEEINIEVRGAFLEAGGKEFSYIPCLNADQEWLSALEQLCTQHLQGWLPPSPSNPSSPSGTLTFSVPSAATNCCA